MISAADILRVRARGHFKVQEKGISFCFSKMRVSPPSGLVSFILMIEILALDGALKCLWRHINGEGERRYQLKDYDEKKKDQFLEMLHSTSYCFFGREKTENWDILTKKYDGNGKKQAKMRKTAPGQTSAILPQTILTPGMGGLLLV